MKPFVSITALAYTLIAIGIAVASMSSAFADDVGLDLDGIGGEQIELVAGERRRAEIEARKAVPPKVVGRWNFDDMVPGKAGRPRGWWAGIWGDRKVNYGNDVGADGTGRSFLVDVRSIVGGELQIFSPGWQLKQGLWYKITFKIRGWDHPDGLRIQVREAAGQWRSPLGHIWVRPTDEWKEYSFGGQSSCSMDPGQFGIMLGIGTAGVFAIDDVKVEEYLENPFPPPVPSPPVSFKPGNLIPRGSFESAADPFWYLNGCGGDPDNILFEPIYSRAEGGHSGSHCLRYSGRKMPNGKLSAGSTIKSIQIPVTAGTNYVFSIMARTDAPFAGIRIGGKSGHFEFSGKNIPLRVGEGWKRIRCFTKPIPKDVRSVAISIDFDGGEEVFVDSAFFGVETGHAPPFVPSAPFELDLDLVRDNPESEPRIVEWGESLPLAIGVWPTAREMQNAECRMQNGDKVGVTLKCTGYPNKRGREEHLELVAGEQRKIDFDPGLNGILRVELVPDDPAFAKPLEVIMGRLPKPRATGAKGRFGIHMRISPQIMAFARAIGLTWQRIHDCSPITNMGFGNPEPGKYRWADAEVDALRDYGFSILGMPDYPPKWMFGEKRFEDKAALARAEAREKEIRIPTQNDVDWNDEEGEILADALKREKEADRKLHSWTKYVYSNEAFRVWCRELASHFKGRIDHFEMWNEPYMEYFFKGTPDDYMALFHAGAKGIREGNPDAKVLGYCNEFNCERTYSDLAKKYPVAEKPDYNTMHYYYMGVPGTGEFGIEGIVARYPKAFGEHLGSELWNTEGNLGGGSSFYSWRYNPRECEGQAAFGVRGWGDTFHGGVDRVFIFGMFNTDQESPAYLLDKIDYDRSLNVWAAATATTAYFIDCMKPHREIPSPKGAKLRVFSGGGYVSAYIFDDCLERGRPLFDATKLPAGYTITDAMGNDLRAEGPVPLTPVPFFVSTEGVAPAVLAEAISAALTSPDP